MRAIVCAEPGPVSVLQIKNVPVPSPAAGQVLVRILGFGINRAEMYTRQGHSPGLTFPLVLGIECVGRVAAHGPAAPGTPPPRFAAGERVATCMGGLGRETPGSYQEYCCVAEGNLRAVAPGGGGQPRREAARGPARDAPDGLGRAHRGARRPAGRERAGARRDQLGRPVRAAVAAGPARGRPPGGHDEAGRPRFDAEGGRRGRGLRRRRVGGGGRSPGARAAGSTNAWSWSAPRRCWTAPPACGPGGRSP